MLACYSTLTGSSWLIEFGDEAHHKLAIHYEDTVQLTSFKQMSYSMKVCRGLAVDSFSTELSSLLTVTQPVESTFITRKLFYAPRTKPNHNKNQQKLIWHSDSHWNDLNFKFKPVESQSLPLRPNNPFDLCHHSRHVQFDSSKAL